MTQNLNKASRQQAPTGEACMRLTGGPARKRAGQTGESALGLADSASGPGRKTKIRDRRIYWDIQ